MAAAARATGARNRLIFRPILPLRGRRGVC